MGTKVRARRFTIGDAMVLVAATAAGLACDVRALPFVVRDLASHPDIWDRLSIGVSLGLPCLLAWTTALLGLRLRRPRPPWRTASNQVGTTANLAALIAAAITGPINFRFRELALNWREYSGGALAANLLDWLADIAPAIGFAAILAWTLLAIQRRWRCEPSWIDRAGRIAGGLWIVAGCILAVCKRL